MLEFFMCLMLKLLKSVLKLLIICNIFSLKFVISNFLAIFFEFSLFFPFFPTKIAKLGKFETKNICYFFLGGGWQFNY